MAAIPGRADQPPEGLGEPRADDPVVIGGAAIRRAACAVEHRGLGPGDLLHHHAAQALARYVDPVAQRVGAEQRGARIVAESWKDFGLQKPPPPVESVIEMSYLQEARK